MAEIVRGHVSRRQVLRRGALAVGAVWSVPAVRAVHVVQTVGSPRPGTTTSNPPSTFSVQGTFRVTRSDTDVSDPNCVRVQFDASTALVTPPDFPEANPGALHFDVCFAGLEATEGNLSLVLPSGDLAASLESGSLFPGRPFPSPPPGPLPAELRASFLVIGGADAFAGAAGSLGLFATWPSGGIMTTGTIFGEIQL